MWASLKYQVNSRMGRGPENQRKKNILQRNLMKVFLLNRKGSLSVDEWSMAQSYTNSRIMQDKEKYKASLLLAVNFIFGNKSNPALEVERLVKDERFFYSPYFDVSSNVSVVLQSGTISSVCVLKMKGRYFSITMCEEYLDSNMPPSSSSPLLFMPCRSGHGNSFALHSHHFLKLCQAWTSSLFPAFWKLRYWVKWTTCHSIQGGRKQSNIRGGQMGKKSIALICPPG